VHKTASNNTYKQVIEYYTEKCLPNYTLTLNEESTMISTL